MVISLEIPLKLRLRDESCLPLICLDFPRIFSCIELLQSYGVVELMLSLMF